MTTCCGAAGPEAWQLPDCSALSRSPELLGRSLLELLLDALYMSVSLDVEVHLCWENMNPNLNEDRGTV